MSGNINISSEQFRKMRDKGVFSVGKKGKLILNDPNAFSEPDVVSDRFDLDNHPELVGYVFIPGKVYSSKRGKRISIKNASPSSKWKCKTKNGWKFVTPFIRNSKWAEKYITTTQPIYNQKKEEFLEFANGPYPWYVEFVFVVSDKRTWDWNNLTQVVQDQMVRAGWLPDDSVKYMYPVVPTPPGQPYIIDKGHEGVYIKKLNI